MRINEIIREKRKEKNMTQEALAELLGVSAPAVNKWEKDIKKRDDTEFLKSNQRFKGFI